MKIFWIILFVCNLAAYGQRISPGSTDSFVADTFVGYDNLGYAYFEYNNTFSRWKDGNSVDYKNLALGKIRRADILNPLKIVLFYADFNTVVMLDNQLNEVQQINFSQRPEQILVAATGNASRNRLWVFNGLTQELALFDYLRNEYNVLTQPLNGNIIYYETDFNSFNWIDDDLNRFSCDVYGKITALGTIPEFDAIGFVNNDTIIYLNGTQISFYKSDGTIEPLLEIDKNTFKSFSYSQQNLSIFTNTGITNYKITTP